MLNFKCDQGMEGRPGGLGSVEGHMFRPIQVAGCGLVSGGLASTLLSILFTYSPSLLHRSTEAAVPGPSSQRDIIRTVSRRVE